MQIWNIKKYIFKNLFSKQWSVHCYELCCRKFVTAFQVTLWMLNPDLLVGVQFVCFCSVKMLLLFIIYLTGRVISHLPVLHLSCASIHLAECDSGSLLQDYCVYLLTNQSAALSLWEVGSVHHDLSPPVDTVTFNKTKHLQNIIKQTGLSDFSVQQERKGFQVTVTTFFTVKNNSFVHLLVINK